MRKPQEINVIIHYPTTLYGTISFAMRLAYSEPERVYDRIKHLKMSSQQKAELLSSARKKAQEYRIPDYEFYKRQAGGTIIVSSD